MLHLQRIHGMPSEKITITTRNRRFSNMDPFWPSLLIANGHASWTNFPNNTPPECRFPADVSQTCHRKYDQKPKTHVCRKWCITKLHCVEGTSLFTTCSTHPNLPNHQDIPGLTKLPAPPPFCRNRSAIMKPTRKMSAIPQAWLVGSVTVLCDETLHNWNLQVFNYIFPYPRPEWFGIFAMVLRVNFIPPPLVAQTTVWSSSKSKTLRLIKSAK